MEHENRPRVFLDSNVLVSALYSPDGAPGAILRQFIGGRIQIVVSRQVLEEVVRTIKEKLPAALPALNRLLVNAPPEVVENPSLDEVTRWDKTIHPNDAPTLAAAVAAKPDYVVTGDNHFFASPRIAEETGLRIVRPSELIEGSEDGAA